MCDAPALSSLSVTRIDLIDKPYDNQLRVFRWVRHMVFNLVNEVVSGASVASEGVESSRQAPSPAYDEEVVQLKSECDTSSPAPSVHSSAEGADICESALCATNEESPGRRKFQHRATSFDTPLAVESSTAKEGTLSVVNKRRKRPRARPLGDAGLPPIDSVVDCFYPVRPREDHCATVVVLVKMTGTSFPRVVGPSPIINCT